MGKQLNLNEFNELTAMDALRRGLRIGRHENVIGKAARKQLEISNSLFESQAMKYGARQSTIQQQADDDMGDNINWHSPENHYHYPPNKKSLADYIMPALLGGAVAAAASMYYYTNKPPSNTTVVNTEELDVDAQLGASDTPPKS